MSSVSRRIVVSPGMCGGGSRFFARVGDWTWEAVAAACGIDVHLARTPAGESSYLSFYYFRSASRGLVHPDGLTFGDRLEVTSRVFDFGAQSVLTLHRIAVAGHGADLPPTLEPEEFYQLPRADCIYVENFNRWIARSPSGRNEGLVEASPVGFRHEQLPRLPSVYSPRAAVGRARQEGSFWPDGVPDADLVQEFSTTYAVDVVRDLNGVGLVYFASYFSIVDRAVLGAWQELGRTDQCFANRRVLDQRLGYFGNADIGSVFAISVRMWRSRQTPEREIADVAIRAEGTGRLLAVAALETLMDGTDDGR